jgi:WD40 repeat protein
MEEYFVYHGRPRGGPLREALAEILARPTLRVHVLLGIRDDALAELDAFKGRVPGLFGNVLRLDHLDVDSARAAILEPLAELEALGGPHVEAEPALVAAVVDQVASGRIERRLAGRGIIDGAARRGRVEAPYLQLVMDRIWQVERERGSDVLRVETLAELGGAGRIVQQHLELALAGLDLPERELVARLFHQLVTPSGTKIAHAVGDLSRYAHETPERLEDILHALSTQRVVRALPGRNGGGARYEIYHDVLAGAVLDWGARHESERALAEERAAARRRHRRLAGIIGLAVVALTAMGLLTVFAFAARSDAREKAALAKAAQLEAEASERVADEKSKALEGALAESEQSERTAIEERIRADDARKGEAKQRLEAEAERDRADGEAARANGEAARADRERDEATAAKADAVKSKDEAVESKVAAVKSRDEAKLATKKERLQRTRAVAAKQQADARALVNRAVSLLRVDPEYSLQLALQSAKTERTVALEGALREGLVRQTARRVLPGGGGQVSTVAVSGDGTRVLVPAAGGEARIFQLGSGKLVSQVRHGARINDAAFAPDGRSFATGGADGFVRTWNTQTGDPLVRVNHGASIRDLALSPDGRFLATAAGEAARIWDLAGDGRLVRALPHPFAVEGVSFDPAGGLLMSIARDARVFDVATWQTQALLDQPGNIVVAEFAPSGSLVLTGGRDDLAMIWDWRAPTAPRHRLAPHGSDVLAVAWSPRGDLVATASSDNAARVWRVDNGLPYSFLAAHSNQVTGVAFSPDGSTIATSSLDGSARIWTGAQYARSESLLGHRSPDSAVRAVAFTPDGSGVVTASNDGTARLWKHSVDPIATFVGRQTAAGRAVEFSRDGGLIVTAGLDATVRFWRRNGTEARSFAHPGAVVDLAVSRDGLLLLTAGQDGTARVWRFADGRFVRAFVHGAALRSATFDAAGTRIATAGDDGIARVWDAAGGRVLRELRHGGVVMSVAFSPDGTRLATGGDDAEGRVWRLPGGKLLGKLIDHEDDVLSIAFNQDGKQLVTGSLDADARLWNASTFELQRILRGHSAVVSKVAFSFDGRWVATAGPTTVGLWDSQTGRRIDAGAPGFFVRGHGPRVRSVVFAPGSWRIASVGDDGTVRTHLCELCGRAGQLAKLAQRRLTRLGANLTQAERERYIGG